MWHLSSYKIEIFKTVLPWDQFSDFKTLASPKVSGKLPLGIALQWEAKVTPKTLTYNKILPGCELCLTNKVEIILCEEWKGAEPSNRLFFFFYLVRVKSFWTARIKLFRDHSDSLHQPCSLSGLWKGGQLQEAGDSHTSPSEAENLYLRNVPNLGDRVYYLKRSSITFNGQNPES